MKRVLPKGLMPIDHLFGDDAYDTSLLRQMGQNARAYLDSQSWCAATYQGYFAVGYGGILAIFLFRIKPVRRGIDNWMWTVVGDIPPAYLPLSDAETAKEVFNAYLQGMHRWIAVVRNERPDGPDVPPISLAATPELADDLERRLAVLMEMLPPAFVATIQ